MPSSKLEIRYSTIFNPYVKKPFKVFCIGDIHLSSLTKKEDIDNIIWSINIINPDYICIAGDLINSSIDLDNQYAFDSLNTLLKKISLLAPVFIVLGNHDFIIKDGNKYIEDTIHTRIWQSFRDIPNVYLLEDDVFEDSNIFIGGYRQKVDSYFGIENERCEKLYNDLVKHDNLVKKLPVKKPTIFLTHSPEFIVSDNIQKLLKSYNIILTGHYHNSCMPTNINKFFGSSNRGIITPNKRLFPKYARGVLKLDTGAYLFYSGGWTKLGSIKALRSFDKFFNRQIDVITFDSNSKTNTYKQVKKFPN